VDRPAPTLLFSVVRWMVVIAVSSMLAARSDNLGPREKSLSEMPLKEILRRWTHTLDQGRQLSSTSDAERLCAPSYPLQQLQHMQMEILETQQQQALLQHVMTHLRLKAQHDTPLPHHGPLSNNMAAVTISGPPGLEVQQFPMAKGTAAAEMFSSGQLPMAAQRTGEISEPQQPHRAKHLLDPVRLRSKQVTTLMLSDLPTSITQDSLKTDLDACGFRDRYDFVYLPHSIARLEVLGYAFINFCSPETAAEFATLIGECSHSGVGVQVAKEQGLKRLVALCLRRGLHKLRNSKYRPWLKEPNLLAAARHG